MSAVPFIANESTTVPVTRTIQAIQGLVERFRAREFRTLYGHGGTPNAVRFTVIDPHLSQVEGEEGVFTVELSAPSEMIRKALWRKARSPNRNVLEAKAERIAWRQLHDIIRASLMGVESGLFTIGEAFLANLVVARPDGKEARLGQMLMEQRLLTPVNGRLMIGAGGVS